MDLASFTEQEVQALRRDLAQVIRSLRGLIADLVAKAVRTESTEDALELASKLEAQAAALLTQAGYDGSIGSLSASFTFQGVEKLSRSYATIPNLTAFVNGEIAQLLALKDAAGARMREALLDAWAAGSSPAQALADVSAAASITLGQAAVHFATALMAVGRQGLLADAGRVGVDLFVYDGPDDGITRPFCAKYVGTIVTKADLDRDDNGQGLRPTSLYLGGYNCRHGLSPITLEEARAEIAAGTLRVGPGATRAQAILDGRASPGDDAFRARLAPVQLTPPPAPPAPRARTRKSAAKPKAAEAAPAKPITPTQAKAEARALAPSGTEYGTGKIPVAPKEKLPEKIEDLLGKTADAVEDVFGQRPVANSLQLDRGDMGSSLGARSFITGRVSFSKVTTGRLRSALARIGKTGGDAVLTMEESRGLKTLLHEFGHGLPPDAIVSGPQAADVKFLKKFRSGNATAIEEGTNELWAVRNLPGLAERWGLKVNPDLRRDGAATARTHSYVRETTAMEAVINAASGNPVTYGRALNAEGEAFLRFLRMGSSTLDRVDAMVEALVARYPGDVAPYTRRKLKTALNGIARLIKPFAGGSTDPAEFARVTERVRDTIEACFRDGFKLPR